MELVRKMNDMVNINKNSPDNSGDIILGDESAQKAISFQLAQAFYNEITGKSEQLNEEFFVSFILTFDNIKQLHNRITQSIVQYNAKAANASFAVKYLNDSSERFSSIERFELHATEKGIPVEEIDISYNLLFVLPQTNKPQEYKINIRLMSRIAKIESMKDEIEGFPFVIPYSQFEKKFTCRVSISFIDVTVAISLMAVINNWVGSLQTTQLNSFLKYARGYSYIIPTLAKNGLLVIAVACTYFLSDKYLLTPTDPYKTLANYMIFAMLFSFTFYKLGAFLGKKSEQSLDRIYQISYIYLSGADKNLADTTESLTRGFIGKSIFFIVLNFIIGLSASIVANKFFA